MPDAFASARFERRCAHNLLLLLGMVVWLLKPFRLSIVTCVFFRVRTPQKEKNEPRNFAFIVLHKFVSFIGTTCDTLFSSLCPEHVGSLAPSNAMCSTPNTFECVFCQPIYRRDSKRAKKNRKEQKKTIDTKCLSDREVRTLPNYELASESNLANECNGVGDGADRAGTVVLMTTGE